MRNQRCCAPEKARREHADGLPGDLTDCEAKVTLNVRPLGIAGLCDASPLRPPFLDISLPVLKLVANILFSRLEVKDAVTLEAPFVLRLCGRFSFGQESDHAASAAGGWFHGDRSSIPCKILDA